MYEGSVNMYQKFFFSLFLLVSCLSLTACQTTNRSLEDGLFIDSAYSRKMRTFEPDVGTIHVFLKNLCSQAVGVQDGFINNIPLSNQKEFLWYRISPNPIPPMEICELVVRLRAKPLTSLSKSGCAKLHLITTQGEELFASTPLTNHPLNFTFIGFSDSLDTIFLYIKNSGQRRLSINKVFLSTKDVTRRCRILERKINQNEKKVAVIKLEEPLVKGQYITVKVTTKEGIIAQSRVRAFSDFPIGFDPDGSDIELFMDEAGYKWADNKKNADSVAYHVLDCPMHIGDDHSIEAILSNAKTILSKMDEMEKVKPFLPGYIVVCRANIYNGCANFGQITDLIRINPTIALLPSFSRYIPDEIDYNPVQYLTALAKEASEPRPLHTVIAVTSSNSELNLNPTPELERLLVYYAVSRGSKGIFYRAWGGPLKDKPELQQEIKRINGELQILKRFLKIGELIPLAECTNPDVEPNTILAGDKAVVLILINQKPIEWEKKEDETRCFFSPKFNFKVIVHIPKWMKVKDVYEVGGDFRRLKYIRRRNSIAIEIDRLDFTRQILFTTRSDDYNRDQDKDGISDIEEIVVHGTPPAIPNVNALSKSIIDESN